MQSIRSQSLNQVLGNRPKNIFFGRSHLAGTTSLGTYLTSLVINDTFQLRRGLEVMTNTYVEPTVFYPIARTDFSSNYAEVVGIDQRVSPFLASYFNPGINYTGLITLFYQKDEMVRTVMSEVVLQLEDSVLPGDDIIKLLLPDEHGGSSTVTIRVTSIFEGSLVHFPSIDPDVPSQLLNELTYSFFQTVRFLNSD